MCATDSGLKDSIGTSSHGLLFPGESKAILLGFAGEYQPKDYASSTRQELLGQLGVEYWLEELSQRWGISRKGFEVILITDSQSSIDIMDNVLGHRSIRDTLLPEMDVALEIFRLQSEHQWVRKRLIKVESHIEMIQAPDKIYWECNELVDKLATHARTVYIRDSLENVQEHYFQIRKPGAVSKEHWRTIGCIKH